MNKTTPIWKEKQRPRDKDILAARKTVRTEKIERKRIYKERGFLCGCVYGLIEKIADTPTTKEFKLEKEKS